MISLHKVKKLGALDQSRLDRLGAIQYLEAARNYALKRIRRFAEQAGKNLYSPAVANLAEFYNKDEENNLYVTKNNRIEASMRDPNTMHLNELKKEFSALKKFLNAKTSKLDMARKVQKTQDIRLFGMNTKGKALDTLDLQERIDFWKLYRNYIKTYKTDVWSSRKGSDRIQLAILDTVDGNFESTADKLSKIHDYLDDLANDPRYSNMYDNDFDEDENIF